MSLDKRDRSIFRDLAHNVRRIADELEGNSDDGCPNCGRPAIGSTAVTLHTRGTNEAIDAAICAECGCVFVEDNDRWV